MSPFVTDIELRGRLDPPYTGCVACGDDVSDVDLGTTGAFVSATGGERAYAGGNFLMCADCAGSMNHRKRREAFEAAERDAVEDALDDDERHWITHKDVWAKRAGNYLASTDVGLSDNAGLAVGYSMLGYTAGGISKHVDVTEGTISKYLDRAEKRYPGLSSVTAPDVDGDPDFDLSDVPEPPQTECPVCLHDRLMSPTAAESVYLVSDWGATAMLDEADLVCAWCHSVKTDGEWRRMQALGDRARSVSEAGNKSYQEAKGSLSGGITPGKNSSANNGSGGQKAAADSDDLEW